MASNPWYPSSEEEKQIQHGNAVQYFLKGLPMPSANGFILLGSKSPFPDTADTGQNDNFALNYLAMKVKLTGRWGFIGHKY